MVIGWPTEDTGLSVLKPGPSQANRGVWLPLLAQQPSLCTPVSNSALHAEELCHSVSGQVNSPTGMICMSELFLFLSGEALCGIVSLFFQAHFL